MLCMSLVRQLLLLRAGRCNDDVNVRVHRPKIDLFAQLLASLLLAFLGGFPLLGSLCQISSRLFISQQLSSRLLSLLFGACKNVGVLCALQ